VTIPPASSLSTWRAGRTHPPTPSDIVTTLWSYKEKGRFRSIFWRSHSPFFGKSPSPRKRDVPLFKRELVPTCREI
ncbi:MAG: hypothetical protein KKH32_06660, partial [Bacteroidetes bacterium]|nr:hypothetical protein [Bacteroidota bacterium]